MTMHKDATDWDTLWRRFKGTMTDLGEGAAAVWQALPDPAPHITAARDKLYAARERYQQALAAKRQEASNAVAIKALLAAGGLGMAIRGAQEVGSLLHKPQPSRYPTGPLVLDLPYPTRKPKRKTIVSPADEEEDVQQVKAAQEPAPASTPATSPTPVPTVTLPGDKETSLTEQGLMGLPLWFAGGGLGLYGGYKLVDAVLDRQRRQAKEKRLQEARDRFQQAIVDQYTAGRGNVKRAADVLYPEAGEEKRARAEELLDTLFDKLSESATKIARERLEGIVAPAEDASMEKTALWGTLTGIGAAALLPIVVGSTIVGWRLGKKNTNRHILEKALQRRQQREWDKQPFEIYARPLPVDVEDEESSESASA